MDDILIGSKDIKQHLEILVEVLRRLVVNKLELRMDKCKFLQDKVKHLGFLISNEEIKADEKALEAIQYFPVPNNTKLLRSLFLLPPVYKRFFDIGKTVI